MLSLRSGAGVGLHVPVTRRPAPGSTLPYPWRQSCLCCWNCIYRWASLRAVCSPLVLLAGRAPGQPTPPSTPNSSISVSSWLWSGALRKKKGLPVQFGWAQLGSVQLFSHNRPALHLCEWVLLCKWESRGSGWESTVERRMGGRRAREGGRETTLGCWRERVRQELQHGWLFPLWSVETRPTILQSREERRCGQSRWCHTYVQTQYNSFSSLLMCHINDCLLRETSQRQWDTQPTLARLTKLMCLIV